jgi:hypothetical protein
MNDLLDFVLDAHGGLNRWSGVSTLTANLAAGGPFFGQQGFPDAFGDETLTIDTRRQHAVFTPLDRPRPEPDLRHRPRTGHPAGRQRPDHRQPHQPPLLLRRPRPVLAVGCPAARLLPQLRAVELPHHPVPAHLPRRPGPRDQPLAGGRPDLGPAARHLPRQHHHPQRRAGLLLRRRRAAPPPGLHHRGQRRRPGRALHRGLQDLRRPGLPHPPPRLPPQPRQYPRPQPGRHHARYPRHHRRLTPLHERNGPRCPPSTGAAPRPQPTDGSRADRRRDMTRGIR